MRKLKLEYTAFNYGDKIPSNSFFNELSGQLTPRIENLIANETLRDNLAKLICLSVDTDSYMCPIYQDGMNYMQMNIASLSASLIICKFTVSWHNDIKRRIFPWENTYGDIIHFDFIIENSEIKVLKNILPKLYHPIIKAQKSGLPYDYQIYYGGNSLILNYNRHIHENDIIEIDRILKDYFNERNELDESEIQLYKLKKTTPTQVKVCFDSEFCGIEVIESIIYRFHHQDSIKKIVCR